MKTGTGTGGLFPRLFGFDPFGVGDVSVIEIAGFNPGRFRLDSFGVRGGFRSG